MKKLKKLPKALEREGQYASKRKAMQAACDLERETGIKHRVVKTITWRDDEEYYCYVVVVDRR
ncbi:MAG: hypothetical protein D6746_05170 [Bacteroidetes bacterium]|nr:MAG: hypothetical protein D6746_05170 [Bacteroidota bacterium]